MIKLKELGSLLKDGAVIHYGFATVLSFGHIHDLAAAHGQDGWKAWCYPPSVDLLIYSGWRRIRSGHGAAIGWFAFLFGILVSLAANVAESYYTTHSMVGVVIGVYPSLGMLVATLLSHTDHGPALAVAAVAAEPEVQEEQGGQSQAPEPEAPDTPKESCDTPKAKLPDQRTKAFLPAVVSHVFAGQPEGTYAYAADLVRAVKVFLVSHGYSAPHSNTIRRAMSDEVKKAFDLRV